MSRADRYRLLGLCLVLLLAAGLRFYNLDAQSFWNDEGNTARLVERPVALILEGAAGDIHPPGYYLLLHAWRALAGETEFALRAFSAFCGILTVALAAALGRRAGGWWTSLGAALFAALHPLAVYYGQEARMYALLGLASALVLWAGIHLFATSYRTARIPLLRIVGLGAAVALGLYTQYAFVFVLVGLNLAFGAAWLLRRPLSRRAPLLWAGAHLLGGLAFLPWAPIAVRAAGWRPPDLDASGAATALGRTLVVGVTLPENAGTATSILLAIAALLLLLSALARPRDRFAAWAAASAALIPPALIAALDLYRPAYLKFLMASIAPLGVVLALPLTTRKRSTPIPHLLTTRPLPVGGDYIKERLLLRGSAALLLLALLPAQLTSLRHLYSDPAYARDDYRALAAHVAAEGRPGDAVILSAPNQWEVFTYYYPGPLPVYPAPYRPTEDAAAAWMDEILAQHDRLFVLYWGDQESDPGRIVERSLALKAHKATDAWLGDVRFARYGMAEMAGEEKRSGARLGEAIELRAYVLPEEAYAPGDVVPVTLVWEAIEPPQQRYKVFVHLLSAEGALAAQNDAEPVGGFVPTDSWEAGALVTDRYGLYLPPDLPPGEYRMLVGMYAFSGERLPVTFAGEAAGDAIALGTIRIK